MNPVIISLDEALIKVGGRHRAQIVTLLACACSVMHTASFLMSLPLLILTPSVLCEEGPDSVHYCPLTQACASGQKFVFAANEERSAVFEWRLVCEQALYENLIPLSCLAGAILGCILTGQLGDSLGRRRILFWLLLCSCICQFVLYCSASAPFFTVVIFFVGLFLPAPITLAAILVCELTDKRARGPFLTLLCMCWTLGTAATYSVSFYFLAWRPFLILSVGCGLLFFPLYPLLVESPRFLAANWGWYMKAKATLQIIATRNKREMFKEKLQGEKLNEYDETGGTRLAEDKKKNKSEDSKSMPAGEYIGSAQNAEEREKELMRGQHCSYVDLIRLKTLRKDIARLALLTAVTALDLSEALAPIEGSVMERYLQWAVALAVEFAALLLVCVTSNFAGKKLLLRVAFLSLVCVGLSRLALPEIEEARYAQLGYQAACTVAVSTVVQLSIEIPPTPARALFICALLSLGGFIWTASRFVIDFIPSHHSAPILAGANMIGVLATWRLRDPTKKRLKDYIEELKVVGPVQVIAERSSDLKRVVPKEPSFDAFNEEVRGLE